MKNLKQIRSVVTEDTTTIEKPSDPIAELKDACWKGYEAIGTKKKNGKTVPNCVPKEKTSEETDISEAPVDKHFKVTGQVRNADGSLGSVTHIIRSVHSADQAKSLAAQAAEKKGHKEYKALRTAPHSDVKEDTTTIEKPVEEGSDDYKNLKITKHEKMAIEAERRGDKHAQQYHLNIVKRMKNESVNEAAEPKLGKHLVTITVSDPHHAMITQRKAKILKRAKVSAVDSKEALKKAEAHYRRHGYKVHDSLYHSAVNESLDTDEFVDSYNPEGDNDSGNEDGIEEIRMAKGQLKEIQDMTGDILDAMDDEDELEAWVQNKITTAYDQIDDVYSYLAYGNDDSEEDDTDSSEQDSEEGVCEAAVPGAGEDDEGLGTGISEEDKKALARLRALIRLGLIDESELQTTLRAVKKLRMNQQVVSTAERQAINDLLEKLLGIVTGDDAVFRKVKLIVQK